MKRPEHFWLLAWSALALNPSVTRRWPGTRPKRLRAAVEAYARKRVAIARLRLCIAGTGTDPENRKTITARPDDDGLST